MELLPDWKDVLKKAWSMWAFYALALVSLTEALLPFVDMWFGPKSYALTVFAITVIGAGLRIVKQTGLPAFLKDESGRVRMPRSRAGKGAAGGLAGAAMIAAVAFIGDWEGLRKEAYRDIVGVWTVCYGETKGVQPGDSYSKAECDAMLAREVKLYEAQLDRCLTADVPAGMKIALVSWTYNVGGRAACSSTLVRKANAGDLEGACHELSRWNRAGGRVIRGLTNRRASERELCMAALEQ